MSRLLTGPMGKALRLTRAFGTRPKFYQQTGVYVHPENRRSFPIIKWSKLPQTMELQTLPKGKESLRPWSKREHRYSSDMLRWAEFRRKMAYGIY